MLANALDFLCMNAAELSPGEEKNNITLLFPQASLVRCTSIIIAPILRPHKRDASGVRERLLRSNNREMWAFVGNLWKKGDQQSVPESLIKR